MVITNGQNKGQVYPLELYMQHLPEYQWLDRGHFGISFLNTAVNAWSPFVTFTCNNNNKNKYIFKSRFYSVFGVHKAGQHP